MMYDGRVKTGGGGGEINAFPPSPPPMMPPAPEKKEEKLAIHFLSVARGISKRGHYSPPNTPQPPKDENVSRNERIEKKQGLGTICKDLVEKVVQKVTF